MPFVAATASNASTSSRGTSQRTCAMPRRKSASISSPLLDIGLLQTENTIRPVVVQETCGGSSCGLPGRRWRTRCSKHSGDSKSAGSKPDVYGNSDASRRWSDDSIERDRAVQDLRGHKVSLADESRLDRSDHCLQTLPLGNAFRKSARSHGAQLRSSQKLSNEDVAKGDETATEHLKGRGMLVNNTDAPAFRTAVRAAGLYAQWKTEYPPAAWSLLEKSVGNLS